MQTTTGQDDKRDSTGSICFVNGHGGLPVLKVRTKWSTAEIYLHGAHVTHFEKNDEASLLFLSEKSLFSAGNPIRGGIPIVFPWFGPKEGMPSHGFARTANWELNRIETHTNGAISVHLRLAQVAEAGILTPTQVEYVMTVSEKLELDLLVSNRSNDRNFTFEECLHTYFRVGDINAVSISGLKGTHYLDKVGGSVEKTETGEAIKIASEVDRVYQDTTSAVEIEDAKLRRKILVEKEGSKATVVWNPWITKSKALADFGDEEYLKMVCIESGNVGKNKKTVEPGKTSSMKVRISSKAF